MQQSHEYEQQNKKQNKQKILCQDDKDLCQVIYVWIKTILNLVTRHCIWKMFFEKWYFFFVINNMTGKSD